MAGVPLNFTALAPVKPEPKILTVAPTMPPLGEKPLNDAVLITKTTLLVTVPTGVDIVIGPDVAPVGTTAVS